MPQTYKGPTGAIGEHNDINDATQNRTPGGDQQQPLPNENQANIPESSKKTLNPDHQQHQWNDTDPDKGLSEGVSEHHASPERPKHGKSAEATSKSSTGLPEHREHTGTPPSAEHGQRNEHNRHK
jgi:hypothetical protein